MPSTPEGPTHGAPRRKTLCASPRKSGLCDIDVLRVLHACEVYDDDDPGLSREEFETRTSGYCMSEKNHLTKGAKNDKQPPQRQLTSKRCLIMIVITHGIMTVIIAPPAPQAMSNVTVERRTRKDSAHLDCAHAPATLPARLALADKG